MEYACINPAVILDCGSFISRIGYQGDLEPRFIRPSLYKKNVIIDRGIIKDWNILEKFFFLIFNKTLIIHPEEKNIFITQPINSPKSQKKQLLETMIENFKLKGLYLQNTLQLSSYSTGKLNGVICDSGGGLTQIGSVKDGLLYQNSIFQFNFAGKDVNEKLKTLITNDNLIENKNYLNDNNLIEDIKRKCCFVKFKEEKIIEEEPEEEKNKKPNKNQKKEEEPIEPIEEPIETIEYELPDKNKITLQNQRIEPLEEFFGENTFSISKSIFNSINKSDLENKKTLYKNIVLVGGNTKFENFGKRINQEIKNMIEEQNIKDNINVLEYDIRQIAAFNGASIISSFGTFNENWISKEEYDECGFNYLLKNKLN
jgi:actin beta/gamma 1